MTPLVGWHPHETWAWLTGSPLFGLTLTLGGYAVGRWAHRRTGSPLLQPVLVAIVLVGAVLMLTDVPYADYLAGGRFVGFWLGPATVALALPLHQEWHLVRRAAVPILVGVVAGAVVSIGSAVLLTRVAGGDRTLQLTMAPKAATTPVSLLSSVAAMRQTNSTRVDNGVRSPYRLAVSIASSASTVIVTSKPPEIHDTGSTFTGSARNTAPAARLVHRDVSHALASRATMNAAVPWRATFHRCSATGPEPSCRRSAHTNITTGRNSDGVGAPSIQ